MNLIAALCACSVLNFAGRRGYEKEFHIGKLNIKVNEQENLPLLRGSRRTTPPDHIDN